MPNPTKPKTNLTLGDLVDQFIDGIAVLRPYTRVTKEAKRNLKLIIDTYVKTKVDENSRAYGGCLDCYGKGYATQESATIGYPDFVGDEGFKHHEHKMIFCDCARGGQLSHEVALQVEVAAVKTKQELAN
uniref:hypothetical protein n=1 Tax=Rhodococcus qingshengii TaxID=334542 RepID=UPI001C4DFB70|nr:hypothetical protein [Rhodococcus qingshengii]